MKFKQNAKLKISQKNHDFRSEKELVLSLESRGDKGTHSWGRAEPRASGHLSQPQVPGSSELSDSGSLMDHMTKTTLSFKRAKALTRSQRLNC